MFFKLFGISFHIFAPKRENAFFRISSLDFFLCRNFVLMRVSNYSNVNFDVLENKFKIFIGVFLSSVSCIKFETDS